MLSKKEQAENIWVTVGRIRGVARNNSDQRLMDLINKVTSDLEKLKITQF